MSHDPKPTAIEGLKPGDEFLVAGTVDEVRPEGSVVVVLDGEPVGTVATLKKGTCVLSTGVSPNYQRRKVPRGTPVP